jgi:hypothetical protein
MRISLFVSSNVLSGMPLPAINPRATATVMTVSSVKCDFSLSSGKSLCL